MKTIVYSIIISIGVILAVAAAFLSAKGASAQEIKTEGVNVPIIMYHSIYQDPECEGKYVITPSMLENDIRYLKSNGFTPVFISQLADFCDSKCDLPEKPVALTFDDGCYNILTNVLPVLEKYDFCASISVVGHYTEAAAEEVYPSSKYSYLDGDDIKLLLASGRIELVNHSNNMHTLEGRRGTLQLSTESFEDYRRALLNDTFEAQHFFKVHCGVEPEIYAYPYGLNCAAGREVIAMCGFRAVLGVEEKVNVLERGKKDVLSLLGRFNRPADLTTEEFMSRITGTQQS